MGWCSNSPTVLMPPLHAMQFLGMAEQRCRRTSRRSNFKSGRNAMPSEAEVVKRLSSVPEYREQFKTAFPEDKIQLRIKPRKSNWSIRKNFIDAFPFDEYLKGNLSALNSKELAGLQDFMQAGCITCHSGVAVGGSMF